MPTPDATENIFKIGSTAPSAMLYDALDHFEVILQDLRIDTSTVSGIWLFSNPTPSLVNFFHIEKES